MAQQELKYNVNQATAVQAIERARQIAHNYDGGRLLFADIFTRQLSDGEALTGTLGETYDRVGTDHLSGLSNARLLSISECGLVLPDHCFMVVNKAPTLAQEQMGCDGKPIYCFTLGRSKAVDDVPEVSPESRFEDLGGTVSGIRLGILYESRAPAEEVLTEDEGKYFGDFYAIFAKRPIREHDVDLCVRPAGNTGAYWIELDSPAPRGRSESAKFRRALVQVLEEEMRLRSLQ